MNREKKSRREKKKETGRPGRGLRSRKTESAAVEPAPDQEAE